MKKIALCTMAVGESSHYIQAVRRYFPYNKEYFGEGRNVDYLLFTDRTIDTVEEMIIVPAPNVPWPYTALVKNNLLFDYFENNNQWDNYSHIFFIDADFAIGDYYDFFRHDFVLLCPFWSQVKSFGAFYGGKTLYFKQLCLSFYKEIQFIYGNKLPVAVNIDENYLCQFGEQYKSHIHYIQLEKGQNILPFYDNEDLEAKLKLEGRKIFLHPHKSQSRANGTLITDCNGKTLECIINLQDNYIFNNYNCDFGRLLRINENEYRILWSKYPEQREVLDLKINRIRKRLSDKPVPHSSPVISVVMPVYNVPVEYLKESIESILNQTFEDFELLIIDDGSTETEGIDFIKTYQDPRISLIHNHHNFIDSLNKGILESKGKYIARMDADDIMLTQRLQVQYDFMEANPNIDICGSWIEVFGNKTNIIKTYTEHKQIVALMLLANSMAHPAVILRRSSVCPAGKLLYKQELIIVKIINYGRIYQCKVYVLPIFRKFCCDTVGWKSK
jgi:hypothetical protein